jgi:hypothetical protein
LENSTAPGGIREPHGAYLEGNQKGYTKTFERLLREERKANRASTFLMAKKLEMFKRLGWL